MSGARQNPAPPWSARVVQNIKERKPSTLGAPRASRRLDRP
jgi:hypothetical protein